MNSPATRRALRDDMLAMTENLIAEFAPVMPAGSVLRCVARSREQLMYTGVRTGLVEATEAMARAALSKRIPAHAY